MSATYVEAFAVLQAIARALPDAPVEEQGDLLLERLVGRDDADQLRAALLRLGTREAVRVLR